MPVQKTENLNVSGFDPMPSPLEIHRAVPISDRASATVLAGRETLEAILDRRDPRIFVVVGPCSIQTRSPVWITPGASRSWRMRFRTDWCW